MQFYPYLQAIGLKKIEGSSIIFFPNFRQLVFACNYTSIPQPKETA